MIETSKLKRERIFDEFHKKIANSYFEESMEEKMESFARFY